MSKNLVIVESPAKAKTIEKFLGKDFVVKSSFGHIRDLAKKGLSVDTGNNFQPSYEIPDDKRKIVSELKKISKESEIVWLATDEDREGEAISWHLSEVLNLKPEKTKRIVFHEITESAIKNAVANPRTIDINLVNAQQARRILDRLVGFELSPVLWRKIRPSLSAGRVQSVAVRLIVEREREINEFNSISSYKLTANFELDGSVFLKAECPKRFANLENAKNFLELCKESIFEIENLEVKPGKKSPAAPFTTSTLQQEASRKLGFSVAQTMVVAQKLYEAGKITYMRTDSTNLSQSAVDACEAEIKKEYGNNYHFPRQYKTKSKGAQEAHEAIRPAYMNAHTVSGESSEQRLYELIWKRTIASQMSDAILERAIATISISKSEEKFVAKGELLKFDGFLKVYMESSDDENPDENSGILPPLKVGEILDYKQIQAQERFSNHPPRYTEASLVKKLEELGIGRPSTYAPTISTIQKRQYVIKEDRVGISREYSVLTLEEQKITEEVKIENTGAEKAKLFPTDIGMVVTDFLVENFQEILEYNFTAKVEKEFDEIADGEKIWTDMIADFYKPFHRHVERTIEYSERASGERTLGIDPISGKNIYARIGRFGPLVQIGESDPEKKEKPRFASLRKDQSIETITIEEALELFKLPKIIGQYDGQEMTVNIGRFGPYIKHDGKFYSIPKDIDPMALKENEGIAIILAKRKAESEKLIKAFDKNREVQVLNGRYGPYISIAKNNYKIPKGKDPKSLTLEECLEIADNAPAKTGKFNRFAKKKPDTELAKSPIKPKSKPIKKAKGKLK